MNKEVITFGDNKTEKRKFRYSKYPININNIDIDKIIISIKFSLVFVMIRKNKGDEKLKPFCILLTKSSGYTKIFYEYMSFSIKGNGLLKKYNKIWDKVSNSTEEGFNSEPVQNKKYLKNKIKSYEMKSM